ncbi:MAG TPA: heme o synthase [Gaiellaceae bacterium]|nr:heme o synthase [Gaiellaceae bacterium]
MGLWARATAAAAVAGTALAVVSGAAGWGTAHRLLAALALPPLVALAVLAWTSARRLLPASLVALALFGAAALVTGPSLHLGSAAASFAATSVLALRVFRSPVVAGGALRDYVTLTKPRVMSLLLLTGGAGAFVGAGGVPAAGTFAVTIAGLALACGGAAALNHYLDRDIDPLMGARTARRPVASGRLEPELALEFGVALSAVSFVLLDALVNLPTALLALAGNLFYVFVYTRWLKRTTPQNIVVGGAAGAVPPLVGYASASGHLGWAALVMFGIVFLWTPPHFWALALMIKEHYARARVPMLPVVRGDRETARQIVVYSAVLVAGTLVPAVFGVFGLVYAAVALALGVPLLWWSVALCRDLSRRRAALLFHYSLLYLALLFAAMAIDVAV